MSDAQRVKVKRDGPRGWHWIAAHHYDPARHELVIDEPPQPPAPSPAAASTDVQAPAKRRGRPPKTATPT